MRGTDLWPVRILCPQPFHSFKMFHFNPGLKVSRNGRIAKSWQRIRMNGKPTHMGLGAWPAITLAMARDKAIQNARALKLGRDPRGEIPQIPTFATAEIVIYAEGWKDGGKSENQWRSSLRDYVLEIENG